VNGSDSRVMTTADHVAGRPLTDWKVTTGHRVLVRVGWLAIGLALYGAAVAVVVGIPEAWWVTVGMAVVALVISVVMPEPVPRELITGGRNHIDGRQNLDT